MRVIQFPRRKILSLVFVFSVVLLILGINQVFVPAKQDEPDIFENNEQVAAFNSRDVESVLTPNALELARAGGLRVNQPDLPGVFTYLPHIAQRPEVLIPKYNVSQGRTGVKFVIGIPSIKRPVDVYVYNTVGSLLDAMTESEKQQTLILVCIAEPWNDQYAQEVLSTFKKRFPIEISQGILEVFSPKPEFYPNLARLKLTLGDAKERVRWRSKQNLDYAFLMLHAWTRGEYYIQLEDDLSAQKGFITSMSNTINKQYGEWFLLQFSTLGFIGRLFKCSDVPKIMEFLLMFYNQKPCDWLLDDYLRVQSCGHGENWKKCILKIQKIARPIEPSLFQHEGLHSSLQGTVNKLKDKSYGINQTSIHRNPSIENIISTIKQYSKYDIFSAYMGQDVFWGANPKAGDLVDFLFHPPIPISRVYFASGDKGHPGDKFQNTTIEILPVKPPPVTSAVNKLVVQKDPSGNQTSQQKLAFEQRVLYLADLPKDSMLDTFYVVGKFDEQGRAKAEIPVDFKDIQVVRLRILSDLPNWVILSQIVIEMPQKR